MTFSVMDQEGHEVRRLIDDRLLAGDAKHRVHWDGRDDQGRMVPDGIYRMRVLRRDEGRVIDSQKQIRVDRQPPRVVLTSARPNVIAPGEPGQQPEVRLRYSGPPNEAPVFRVFRTGDGPPRLVLRFRGQGGGREACWDGRLREGRIAPEGDYAFTVQVRDRAGNPTEAPAPVPSPRTARVGTGVSVRPFTLQGPLTVIPAGAVARLRVGPFDRSFEFVLSRLGSPRPVVRGGRIGGSFRVRVPRRTRTGVYLVRVRAGDRRAVWPLAVAGLPQTQGSAARPRPLVVLPALTWQGLNPVVYPLFASSGYFTRNRLVQLLDEANAEGRNVEVLPPLGLDPGLPDLVQVRATKIACENGFPPDTSTLILLAHGSRRNSASREVTEQVARAIEGRAAFRSVGIALLEERPSWPGCGAGSRTCHRGRDVLRRRYAQHRGCPDDDHGT